MTIELALFVVGIVLIVGANSISGAIRRMIHADDHLDLYKMGYAYDTTFEKLATNILLLPKGIVTRTIGLALLFIAISIFSAGMQSGLKLATFLFLGGIVLYSVTTIRERILHRSYKSFFAEAARRKGLSLNEAFSLGPGILNPVEQREHLDKFSDQAVELKYLWVAKRGGIALALVGGIVPVARLVL